jgi:hypothetical protein
LKQKGEFSEPLGNDSSIDWKTWDEFVIHFTTNANKNVDLEKLLYLCHINHMGWSIVVSKCQNKLILGYKVILGNWIKVQCKVISNIFTSNIYIYIYIYIYSSLLFHHYSFSIRYFGTILKWNYNIKFGLYCFHCFLVTKIHFSSP